MLGLADRTQVIDLFEAVMRGDVPAAFAGLRAQYDAGADPAVILSDLATFSHVVTRLKLIPEAAKDPALVGGRAHPRHGFRPERCRSAPCRAPGRSCSRASPRCRPRTDPSRRPRWCWCGSPTRPTCRRPTRRCAP